MRGHHARFSAPAYRRETCAASELPVIAAPNHVDIRAGRALGILGPLRIDIVEVESPEAGTLLPDSYKSAPALTTA
jgi:hypothetical protein